MQRMSMWQIALRRLEMPILNFLAYFVGGAAFAGLFSAVVIILLTGGLAEGALVFRLRRDLPYFVASHYSAGGAAIAFPLLDVQRSAALDRERNAHVHHSNGHSLLG